MVLQMKKKPHPKWASNPLEELEKGPFGTHSPITNEEGPASGGPSPSSPLSESEPEVSLSDSCPLLMAHAYPSVICFNGHKTSSPVQNTPLPGLGTVADVFPLVSQSDVFSDRNLNSVFDFSCPGLIDYSPFTPFNPVNKGSVPMDQDAQKTCTNQCGCLHELACYNVLLELSFRLRRAVDVLARSASHQLGQTCHLHQRISELDTITVSVALCIFCCPYLTCQQWCPRKRSVSIRQSSDSFWLFFTLPTNICPKFCTAMAVSNVVGDTTEPDYTGTVTRYHSFFRFSLWRLFMAWEHSRGL